ncbi:MAG: hypothetical protein C5B55_12450 [Blastocatellia bacterium]|nr:MAG: hypothetical protein C5B55_12450 [Blastocatellia bacterium]
MLEARSGFLTSRPASFINFLEIVVEHASMAYQTHSFRLDLRVRPDQCTTPRTTNNRLSRREAFGRNSILILFLIQLHSPDLSAYSST